MKFTKQNVEKIRLKARTNNDGLTASVTSYVIDKWDDYDEKEYIILDILRYGCQTGAVPCLIYYSDTIPYYEDNKERINELLYDTMVECGVDSPAELFDGRWDKEDPLALQQSNKNLLAWFGFEETMRNVARKFKELEELI